MLERAGFQASPQAESAESAALLEVLWAALRAARLCSPVTLGSFEVPRLKQGMRALRLASTPCTWCFILATTSPSGTAALQSRDGHQGTRDMGFCVKGEKCEKIPVSGIC